MIKETVKIHDRFQFEIKQLTKRRAIERQVQELMREKDMLLEEMRHRVANSLQIIASILLIKARTVQSEETRLQLEDAHQRVLSVAAVQEHLHRGRLPDYVPFKSGRDHQANFDRTPGQ